MSDQVFGGGRSGLQWTFTVMLVTMAASGVILLRALRTYPDVRPPERRREPAGNRSCDRRAGR